MDSPFVLSHSITSCGFKTVPGDTVFTLISNLPKSCKTPLVNPYKPAFEALYIGTS